MSRLKGDNRGLSLIEVLIAVTILAIVAVPFLHAFVTAANTNSKAKSIHEATVLAQSVMEGMKTEKLEDIAKQFDYPDNGFRLIASEHFIDPSTMAAGTVKKQVSEFLYVGGAYSPVVKYEDPSLSGVTDKKAAVTASIYSEDGGLTGEFLGQQSSNVYYFGMESVQEDVSLYDVLVKVDANEYLPGSSNVDANHLYNADSLIQLPVVDLEQDAVYVHQDTTAVSAANDLAIKSGDSITDVQDKMKRTITISVERSRFGAGEYRFRVLAEYLYTYDKGLNTYQYPQYPQSQVCFDSIEAGKDLRSVYLYYYPLYSDSVHRDEITFNNPDQLPVDFYLMKQAYTDASGAFTTTDTEEIKYRMALRLNETGANFATMQTKVHTNLGINIGNTANGAKLPDTAFAYYIGYLNGSAMSSDALKTILTKDILTTVKSDRIYNIEISIYEKGAMSAGYPESMKLTTLQGSRLD